MTNSLFDLQTDIRIVQSVETNIECSFAIVFFQNIPH